MDVNPIFVISVGLALVAMAGVLANSVVILIIIWNRSLHKPINVFHFHLAFVDILMACTCVPFAVAQFIPSPKRFEASLCLLSAYFVLAMLLSSCLLITAIAIYQFVFITAPLEKVPSLGQCLVMIITALTVGHLIASGPLLDWGSYSLSKSVFGCEFKPTKRMGMLTFNGLQMALGYVFPLMVLLFCYLSIWRELEHHDVRMSKGAVVASDLDRHMEAVTSTINLKRTIIYILFTFVLLRTPYFIYILLITLGTTSYLEACLDQIAFWSAYLNVAINPFLYAFKHAEFKDRISPCCSLSRDCGCFCCSRASIGNDSSS